MQVSISNQIYVFLYSLVGGMIVAFIYDMFRVKRKAIKTGALLIFVEDLVYWIIVTLVMFFIIYFSNDGEIRGYVFIGAILGVILYMMLLSRVVVGSSLFILRILYRIIKTAWIILSYPFKLIFKMLSIPLGILGRTLSKTYGKARRVSRNRVSKAAMWGKMLRSRRKKI